MDKEAAEMKPKVSIVSVTYNQEKYVAEALDSFLMQNTDFDFEIIISDDCSTDNTPNIVREYAKKHSNIRPILREKNVGVVENFKGALAAAAGEYIALCEGDDFWLDPLKLQRQIDFLDAHSEYAVCFHRAKVFTEGGQDDVCFPSYDTEVDTSLSSLLANNFIQTNTVVYRRRGNYENIPADIMPLDWYLHLYHAQDGKVGFIDKVMAVYRRHPGGVWWDSSHNMDNIWKKYGLAHLALFIEVQKLFKGSTEKELIVSRQINGMFARLIEIDKRYGLKLSEAAFSKYPEEAKSFAATLIHAIQNNEKDISNLKHAANKANESTAEHVAELEKLNHELAQIKKSKSFLTGYFLLHPPALIRHSAGKTKHMMKNRASKLKNVIETSIVQREYRSAEFINGPIQRNDGVKAAVVIHLFYTETWQEFSSRLSHLAKQEPIDLFITLPKQNIDFIGTILAEYPHAYVLVVPNRGRDVLPFIQVAPTLMEHGYEYLLKLHSKKSTHRTDGNDWLSGMVQCLLPDSESVMADILLKLQDEATGIIGPQGQYISLPVNFKENLHYIKKIITEMYSAVTASRIIREKNEYGFFAGTMFWARLDALKPILEQRYAAKDFDPERGQIDATFAHALERIFCLAPELDHKSIYEVGENGVVKTDYKTSNIPDWSKVYIGPKPQ